MELIIVRVSKAVIVPAKSRKYDFRTDWKFVYKITYPESEQVFQMVGRSNVGLQIENDAQFAKWMVDNFGHGRYHLHIFKKRVSGWTFYNFDCTSNTRFFQVKKEKSFSEKEQEEMRHEYKKKLKELEEADDKEELDVIKDEIDEIESELDISDMIGKEDKRGKIKVRPFKNVNPVYKEHEYESYGSKNQEQKGVDNRVW